MIMENDSQPTNPASPTEAAHDPGSVTARARPHLPSYTPPSLVLQEDVHRGPELADGARGDTVLLDNAPFANPLAAKATLLLGLGQPLSEAGIGLYEVGMWKLSMPFPLEPRSPSLLERLADNPVHPSRWPPPHRRVPLRVNLHLPGVRSKRHTPLSAVTQEVAAKMYGDLAGRTQVFTDGFVPRDGSAVAACIVPQFGMK
ncbi:hypothetical protein HPB51_009314 [Rhipicephalus microplus]|uniref:Uncharacterized protein n=1 Tax=Rhipicephalus microplus TaxID=6941 RepID=A0A9J6F018_RHIMP|nr:hypothetical protein HPB51_009314 [Rhipicephalus microplus]